MLPKTLVARLVRKAKSLSQPLSIRNYSALSNKTLFTKTAKADHDPKPFWNNSNATSVNNLLKFSTGINKSTISQLLSTEAKKKIEHSIAADHDPAKFSERITEDETIEITANMPASEPLTGEDGKQTLAQLDPNRKLTMVFTCTVCNTRSAKQFSWLAYNRGVVLITCPGCDNKHLIADRLHWFDGMSVEDYLAQKGQSVTKAQEFDSSMLDGVSEENKKEILDAWAGKKKDQPDATADEPNKH